MHAIVVLGVGKGVLIREVSSVLKGCPYRGVPLYITQSMTIVIDNTGCN